MYFFFFLFSVMFFHYFGVIIVALSHFFVLGWVPKFTRSIEGLWNSNECQIWAFIYLFILAKECQIWISANSWKEGGVFGWDVVCV